jgi:hypothetical protein
MLESTRLRDNRGARLQTRSPKTRPPKAAWFHLVSFQSSWVVSASCLQKLPQVARPQAEAAEDGPEGAGLRATSNSPQPAPDGRRKGSAA